MNQYICHEMKWIIHIRSREVHTHTHAHTYTSYTSKLHQSSNNLMPKCSHREWASY